MVRVDMSPARAQISNRQKRRRKAQARRRSRLDQLQQKEIRQALAAQKSRERAIAVWNAEEARLEALRKSASSEPAPRTVRFSTQVLVTEIPTRPTATLPTPVPSPIGVALSPSAKARERGSVLSDKAEQLLRAVRASGGRVLYMGDDWSEEDDEEDDPPFAPGPEADAARLISLVAQRPRRTRRAAAARSGLLSGSASSRSERSTLAAAESVLAGLRRGRAGVGNGDRESDGSQSDDEVEPQLTPSADVGEGHVGGGERLRRITPTKVEVDEVPGTPPVSEKKRKGKKKRRKPEVDVNGGERVDDDAAVVDSGKQSGVPENEQAVQADASPKASPEGRKKKKRRFNEKASPTRTTHSLQTSPKAATESPQDRTDPPLLQLSAKPEKGKRLDFSKDEVLANGNGTLHEKDEEEIDSMFGELVKKRAAKKEQLAVESPKRQQNSLKTSKQNQNGKVKHARESPARYTEDGLRIVSYDDIAADQPKGLNGACPFDCSCCF